MKKVFVSILSLALALSVCASLCPGALAADGGASAAPVAENLELKTYQNVSVGGRLSAYDPNGGALEYTVTTEPVKGTIELGEDGSFVYTPRENKKGRDYFGYKAADADGNLSQEATVIIKIEKAKKDVLYSDMRGRADEYSAVLLSERGIFTGEQIGGQYCFSPEKAVTRGEFLSMCLLTAGGQAVDAVLSTGCADDADIPAWMKGYVAAAAMRGVTAASSGAVFAADEPITETEAALVLDGVMNVTSVSYVPLDAGLDPDTAQACANLTACGVFDGAQSGAALTRGAMARMLAAAVAVLDNR